MRTLVERKCGEHREYRFVVANGGTVCCATHTLEQMCGACREAARSRLGPPQLPPVARKHADTAPVREQAPPPPSLTAAIVAARAASGPLPESRRASRSTDASAVAGEILRREMRERHAREFGGR